MGARGQGIRWQFIGEGLVISLTGGLIGLFLGVGLALLVSLTGLLTAAITLGAVLLALGFSLMVGRFFGI